MNLQASIMHHLRDFDEPCTVQDLAHAVGMLEPGESVPDSLRSNLTAMVRNQQVQRHHNGDGVLRYSLLAGHPGRPAPLTALADSRPVAEREPPPAAPAPAAAESAQASVPARKNHRYATGVSDRVLAAFAPGAAPVRRTVIESRISPPLTTTQVVMALQHLRVNGKVARHGNTSNATWSLVSVPPASIQSDQVKRGAVHSALLQARLAIDAALQALEA